MEFQILGKVEKILPVQTFNKKDGTQGCRYSFVLEVKENDFTYKAMFTTLGEDKWKNLAIAEGGTYSISFNISSREWNGKWFTEAKAYKAVRLDNPSGGSNNNQPQVDNAQEAQQRAMAKAQEAVVNSANKPSNADDLPF